MNACGFSPMLATLCMFVALFVGFVVGYVVAKR